MPRRRRDGPPDEPVELVALPDTEAQMVAAKLRTEGVDAVVFAAGTAADLVAIQFSHGSRVMVRRDQLDAATTLLEEWGDPGAAVSDADLATQAGAGAETEFGDGAVV